MKQAKEQDSKFNAFIEFKKATDKKLDALIQALDPRPHKSVFDGITEKLGSFFGTSKETPAIKETLAIIDDLRGLKSALHALTETLKRSLRNDKLAGDGVWEVWFFLCSLSGALKALEKSNKIVDHRWITGFLSENLPYQLFDALDQLDRNYINKYQNKHFAIRPEFNWDIPDTINEVILINNWQIYRLNRILVENTKEQIIGNGQLLSLKTKFQEIEKVTHGLEREVKEINYQWDGHQQIRQKIQEMREKSNSINQILKDFEKPAKIISEEDLSKRNVESKESTEDQQIWEDLQKEVVCITPEQRGRLEATFVEESILENLKPKDPSAPPAEEVLKEQPESSAPIESKNTTQLMAILQNCKPEVPSAPLLQAEQALDPQIQLMEEVFDTRKEVEGERIVYNPEASSLLSQDMFPKVPTEEPSHESDAIADESDFTIEQDSFEKIPVPAM